MPAGIGAHHRRSRGVPDAMRMLSSQTWPAPAPPVLALAEIGQQSERACAGHGGAQGRPWKPQIRPLARCRVPASLAFA
jgi:hypothetical protein